jgi:hypothetical protein
VINSPFFFLSYGEVGVVYTMVIVNCVTFLFIALQKWIQKEEGMNLLKVIYLILMVVVVITVGFTYEGSGENRLTTVGVFILFIIIATMIMYMNKFGQDVAHKSPLLSRVPIPFLEDKSHDLDDLSLFLRAMLKSFFIHIFGVLLILLFTGGLYLIAPNSDLGAYSAQFLFQDLQHFWAIVLDPYIFEFALLCVAIPTLFLGIAASTWPKSALRYDMWLSVFKLVQPVLGLYIGYFIWKEPLKTDYMLFCTILLIAIIFIRYFQESNELRKVIFVLQIQPGSVDHCLKFFSTFKEIDEIRILWGTYNIILFATVRSFQTLNRLSQEFNEFPSVLAVTSSVTTPIIFKEQYRNKTGTGKKYRKKMDK